MTCVLLPVNLVRRRKELTMYILTGFFKCYDTGTSYMLLNFMEPLIHCSHTAQCLRHCAPPYKISASVSHTVMYYIPLLSYMLLYCIILPRSPLYLWILQLLYVSIILVNSCGLSWHGSVFLNHSRSYLTCFSQAWISFELAWSC